MGLCLTVDKPLPEPMSTQNHLLTQHGIFNAQWMDLMKYKRASFDELILKDPIVQSVEQIFSYPQVEYNAVNFTQKFICHNQIDDDWTIFLVNLHLDILVTYSEMSFIGDCDTHVIWLSWKLYP